MASSCSRVLMSSRCLSLRASRVVMPPIRVPSSCFLSNVTNVRLSSSKKNPKNDSGEDEIPDYLKNVEFEEEIDTDKLQLDRSKYTNEIKVRMPDIGEGVECKISQWFKKEGDIIKRDDVLCDIESPDFVFGLEIDDEEIAIMGKILVEASSKPVKPDEVICTYFHEHETNSKDTSKSHD